MTPDPINPQNNLELERIETSREFRRQARLGFNLTIFSVSVAGVCMSIFGTVQLLSGNIEGGKIPTSAGVGFITLINRISKNANDRLVKLTFGPKDE